MRSTRCVPRSSRRNGRRRGQALLCLIRIVHTGHPANALWSSRGIRAFGSRPTGLLSSPKAHARRWPCVCASRTVAPLSVAVSDKCSDQLSPIATLQGCHRPPPVLPALPGLPCAFTVDLLAGSSRRSYVTDVSWSCSADANNRDGSALVTVPLKRPVGVGRPVALCNPLGERGRRVVNPDDRQPLVCDTMTRRPWTPASAGSPAQLLPAARHQVP